MKKKTLIKKLVATTLAAALIFTGCGSSDGGSSKDAGSAADSGSAQADAGSGDAGNSGDLTTVRFGYMTGNIDHLITAVGQEKGFFEKNGIDLQTTEYAAGINTVDALTMDQLDIGIAADFAILNRIGNTEKTDLKIVANYANAVGGQLFANPEKVKDAKDLKGKKIINLPGVVYEYWNVLAVQNAGLSEGDYEFVNVDSQPSGVAVATAGDADVFWGSGEVAAQLQGLGWQPILTLQDLGAMTTMFFVAKEGYAKENAETLKKFYAAIMESIDYIQTNTDDAAKIIETKTGLKADLFKQMLSAFDLGIQFKQATFDYFDGVNKWLKDSNYYKNPFETKDILLMDAAKEAYPDKFEL
ncbi:MAG: ABC transporter substrate-binding protein [Eubacterium sp.]|nr:ABC transporter substrate-binding protein [Eubacterium sp.]